MHICLECCFWHKSLDLCVYSLLSVFLYHQLEAAHHKFLNFSLHLPCSDVARSKAANANSPTESSGYGEESVPGGRSGSRNFAGGIPTCTEVLARDVDDDVGMSVDGVGICLIATVASG